MKKLIKSDICTLRKWEFPTESEFGKFPRDREFPKLGKFPNLGNFPGGKSSKPKGWEGMGVGH